MNKKDSPIEGLTTAFRTLTIISWPGKEKDDLSGSLPWFPVVGLVLGLILYGLANAWMLIPLDHWTAGAALIILTAEICLTRGLHLDGLADWADSIGGFLHRERRLAIMKDTNLGAFGVLALIIGCMAKLVAFERLLVSGSFIWILLICSLSRNMMVELITTLPYARQEEGMADAFVKGASRKHRLVSHAICFVICIPFGPIGVAFFGLAALITELFRKRCRNRFGGITGDLLGTANEIIEVGLLFVCALLNKIIFDYTGWMWVT